MHFYFPHHFQSLSISNYEWWDLQAPECGSTVHFITFKLNLLSKNAKEMQERGRQRKETRAGKNLSPEPNY